MIEIPEVPLVTWMKVTDYMCGWIESELGGTVVLKDHRVISMQHLRGIKNAMRMETIEDTSDNRDMSFSISASRRNYIETWINLDPDEIKRQYNLTKQQLAFYIPIECPQMCMTSEGVLRPWKLTTKFGRNQSGVLMKLLREEFWKAVDKFNKEFAAQKGGKRYTAKEMIEAFCVATGTNDVFLDAIRREWQRRCKRLSS